MTLRRISAESDEGARAQWALVGGHRVLVRHWSGPEPSAPAVVLVHGAVSGRYLLPTARLLGGEFKVVAPDLPGVGQSTRPRRGVRIEEHADLLAELIETMGLGEPTVLGHSVGAQIAASLAGRHPDAVGRLVLAGPTGDPKARSVTAVIGRWLATAPAEPLAFNLLACRELCDVGPRRMVRTVQAALADPFFDNLARVRAPTVVVRGERDRVAPQRWCEEVASRLGNTPVFVVPGRAHTLVYSSPAQLARTVSDLLCARDPSRCGDSHRSDGGPGLDTTARP